jgi:hypothetical protein
MPCDARQPPLIVVALKPQQRASPAGESVQRDCGRRGGYLSFARAFQHPVESLRACRIPSPAAMPRSGRPLKRVGIADHPTADDCTELGWVRALRDLPPRLSRARSGEATSGPTLGILDPKARPSVSAMEEALVRASVADRRTCTVDGD